MPKICVSCGHLMEDFAVFCGNCGAPVPRDPPPDQPMQPPVQRPIQPQPYRPAPPVNAPAQPVPAPRPAGRPDPRGQTRGVPVQPGGVPAGEPRSAAKKKKSNAPVIILTAIAAALVVAAVLVFLFVNPFGDGSKSSSGSSSSGVSSGTQPHVAVNPDQPIIQDLPTAAPDADDAAPTVPSDSGRATIQSVIDTAFDNYYFRTRNVDDYLSVILEYNFALSDSDRRTIYDQYVRLFADTQELDDLQKKYGDDITIGVTITDVETLTGNDREKAFSDLTGDCDLSRIEEVVHVTFHTDVVGSKSSEQGLWYGYFFKVDGKWYTDIKFI